MTEEPWRIEIRGSALKDLRRLSRTDRERLAAAIDKLPAGDVRKLTGVERIWRLRVGDWRVLFRVDYATKLIDVQAVRPRGRAYD